ncbi:MAG: DegT/DnrJ/EryC1/StrS family aminotransferase, partial [Proteobacteria bacterium]|nr:DegT/DnrJ/EryC1/StrS family aminotransferase [Pseudomonadota bacterium]
MIKYSTQCIDENDIKAVVDALKSDFLTQGPLVEVFEKKIAQYLDCKHAISVNSATSGLHLA